MPHRRGCVYKVDVMQNKSQYKNYAFEGIIII
jgi:hypothetical protein